MWLRFSGWRRQGAAKCNVPWCRVWRLRLRTAPFNTHNDSADSQTDFHGAAGYAHSAADDVTYFDDIAAATRIDGIEEWTSYLASLPIPPHGYEIIDPKVQVYGDVGILTLHYHGLGPEGEVLSRWTATVAYRHDGGAWHKVHAHWSLIKDD